MTSSLKTLLLSAALPAAASAATLTWDPTQTPATPAGGTGSWETATALWSDGAADQIWPNLADSVAAFGGTAGTVTLGSPITANGLTFNTTGYIVTGNTLTLAGTTPTVTVNTAGDTATLSSIIAGTAGLTKAGAGTLVLNSASANTYTGGTTVNAGTLQFSALNNLQGASSIASGATVNFVSALTGTTALTNTFTGAGTLQLTLNGASGNTTTANVTGMTGTVRVSTSGSTGNKWDTSAGLSAAGLKAIIDSGAQLYVGAATTTLSSVSLTGTGNTENRGALRLGGTLTSAVTLTGNTTLGTEGGTLNGTLATGGYALTLGTANSTGNLTFSGASVTGGGTINVTQGQLTLSKGGSTINLGTTNLSVSAGKGLVLAYGTGLSGGSVTLGVGSKFGIQNGGGSPNGVASNIVLASGSGSANAAQIGGFIFGNNTNITGSISGSGDLRWMTGILGGGTNSATVTAGSTTTGWAANSYTGATSFEGVNLTFNLASNTNNATVTPFGATANVATINGGATFRLNQTGTAGNTTIIANAINLNAATGQTTTFYREDGNLRMTGNLDIATAGTGKVVVKSRWGGDSKRLNLEGVLSGAGALTITNNGDGEIGAVALLNNANTYSGTLTVDATGGGAGYLVLGADGAASGASVNLAASGAQLRVGAANATIASLTGVAGSNVSGQTGVTGGSKLTVNQAGSTTFAGVIGGVGPSGGTTNIAQSTSALALVKTGAGTLTLSGANTYTGGTTVTGGTLALSGAGKLGATTGALAVNTGGTLDLGATSQTVGAVTLGGGTVQNGTLAGTSYASTGGTLSATLTGAGAFTQISGTTALSGANTGYSGTVTVNGGTLAAGHLSALGTGALALNGGSLTTSVANVTSGAFTLAGGTLALNGSGAGTVTLAANQHLAITSGQWNVDLANGLDQILGSGTGTFDITGGVLDLGNGAINYAGTYQLISGFTSGSVTGGTIQGYDHVSWVASLDNTGLLSFTAVPEPSTYGLLGAGALAAAAFVRRRRQRADRAA